MLSAKMVAILSRGRWVNALWLQTTTGQEPKPSGLFEAFFVFYNIPHWQKDLKIYTKT